MPREKGDFGRSGIPDKAKGKATDFPPIVDRDPELKTTRGKTNNPASEEDSPMSTPV
jgi:hypothetical protein